MSTSLQGLRCIDATQGYRPQFAFATPEGFHDEPFIVNFTFTIPGSGQPALQLPWQLDDDVPFIIRGIFFPQIGLQGFPLEGNPGFIRIRDTEGNPLSEGLVLSAGVWCESGQLGENAFGFPIEPEIECSPGGALLFDFQINTNASIALLDEVGGATTIEFNANIFGTAGNAITVQAVNPGAPNVALSVGVIGNAVTITLGTDGGGAINSTYNNVVALINGNAAASAVLTAQIVIGPGTDLVVPFGVTTLHGGVASSPITLVGSLIGVKRFKDC